LFFGPVRNGNVYLGQLFRPEGDLFLTFALADLICESSNIRAEQTLGFIYAIHQDSQKCIVYSWSRQTMEQFLKIGAHCVWMQDVLVLEVGAVESQDDASRPLWLKGGSDVYSLTNHMFTFA
jgi:hypothetical protein